MPRGDDGDDDDVGNGREKKKKKRKEREAEKSRKKLLSVLDSSFRCETPVCHCDLLMHFAKTWPL